MRPRALVVTSACWSALATVALVAPSFWALATALLTASLAVSFSSRPVTARALRAALVALCL
jgi:hypothetical protein